MLSSPLNRKMSRRSIKTNMGSASHAATRSPKQQAITAKQQAAPRSGSRCELLPTERIRSAWGGVCQFPSNPVLKTISYTDSLPRSPTSLPLFFKHVSLWLGKAVQSSKRERTPLHFIRPVVSPNLRLCFVPTRVVRAIFGPNNPIPLTLLTSPPNHPPQQDPPTLRGRRW